MILKSAETLSLTELSVYIKKMICPLFLHIIVIILFISNQEIFETGTYRYLNIRYLLLIIL